MTDWIIRRGDDPRINLKSNELIHPAACALLQTFERELIGLPFHRYPKYGLAVARIAEHFGREPCELVLTPGSDAAIRSICHHVANTQGSAAKLILQHPNYEAWLDTARARAISIEAIVDDGSGVESQDRALLGAAAASTHAVIAVSVPNGPTGACLPRHQLEQLIQLAEARDHLLVIDSCYQAFCGPLLEYAAIRSPRVLTLQTLSKSHGLAACRISLLFGMPTLLRELAPEPLEHMVSAHSLGMACLALDAGARFEAIWADIGAVREDVASALEQIGLAPLPSGGNFLNVALGSDELATETTRLLSEAGYRVRDVSGLPGLAGAIRFTIADEQTMRRFVPVLRSCVDQARADHTRGS